MARAMRQLFTILVLLATSNLVLAVDTKWHQLEIGFNLDYPDRVHYFEPAIAEISRLGIRNVYIYEIFDGNEGNEYQLRLKHALDHVLKYGMRPIICISNTHARLQPGGNVKQHITKALPLSVTQKIEHHLTYTNRYPPNDWDAYRTSIEELVEFLFSNYGRKQVRSWLFEIGNEPDAPRYYWGSQEQFAKMFSIAVNVLHQNGIRNVGGPGVTYHSVLLSKEAQHHHDLYHNFMKNTVCDALSDGFISFHLFYNGRERPLKGFPDWLTNTDCQVMITGWNVSSRSKIATKTFNQPGAWGAAFIQLLADCARYGIDQLYIFNLMDYPRYRTPQLGAFDRTGKAKSWHSDFAALWEVIRDGYRVIENEKTLIIEGVSGNRIILSLTHTSKVDSPIIYTPNKKSNIAKMNQPDEWVIVSGKSGE